jgi:hypothetical protein
MMLNIGHVLDAEDYATHSHGGQFDKAGRPYIGHPNGVAWRVRHESYLVRVVAWLHDIVEDTAVTFADVRLRFGDEAADAVDAITHRKGEPRDDCYARVKAYPTALEVKAADLADNTDPWRTRMLNPTQRAGLATKYAHAYEVLGLAPSVRPGWSVPAGRIPVVVGDFATRGKDEVLIVWATGFTIRPVLTKSSDRRSRGNDAREAFQYHGPDLEQGHVYSLDGAWTVTDPMR